MSKPYSVACERNREPILSVIKPLLTETRLVLEIGSGTGQHAVYFAEKLPHLTWQCSDQQEYIPGIKLWLEESGLSNTPLPLVLDVTSTVWQDLEFDAVYSANTVHIMSWAAVKDFISGAVSRLPLGGQLILYGPYNYDNQYTSDSNRQFDISLKARDPASGIRNFEDINSLATAFGMEFVDDVAMPANNRILHWKKISTIT